MAMKHATVSAVGALNSSSGNLATTSSASPGSKKIIGVFYKANEYASMIPIS